MKYILLVAFFVLISGQDVTVTQTPCPEGICCNADGTFKTAVNVCRVTSNPCELPTYCTGYTADCPLTEKKLDDSSCLGDGVCVSGHCVRRECVGECCIAGNVAPDGEKCAQDQGYCYKGTCMVVELKKNVQLTPQESAAKQLAQKNVRQKIEESLKNLLAFQERIVIRQKRRELIEEEQKETFLENIASLPGISTLSTVGQSTLNNIQDAVPVNLQATAEKATSTASSFGFYNILGIALVVVAAIALIAVLGSGKGKGKQERPRRRKVKVDTDTDVAYEPPEF